MRAIHYVTPKAGHKEILEVGGGESGLSAMLFPSAQITNIDIEPRYRQAACNNQSRVKFVCGDATDLPFPDSSFDTVTMFDLLEHVPDHQKAVTEALRVLRPKGYLLISTPNDDWKFPYYAAMQPICPKDEEVMAEWGHVRRGYSLLALKSLIPLTCERWMTFINPVTVLCHDVAFSKLSSRWRRTICTGLSPLTWLSYWLHRPHTKGTETASAWRKE